MLLVAACGGGGGAGNASSPVATAPSTVAASTSCGPESVKRFVFDTTTEWYRFADALAMVDPNDYDDGTSLLSALTAPLASDGRDPGFSFLTTIAVDDADFSTGAYIGFGFRFTVTRDGRFIFSDILETAPAGEAGLQRGDEVVAIDSGAGFEPFQDILARSATTREIFGANEVGIRRGFRVSRQGTVRDVELAKRVIETPPLAGGAVLLEREGTTPVGYLNLRDFALNARTPLSDASAMFRREGVTDLVIDLRYNGGGAIDIADHLLDLLGGEVAEGNVSFQLRHNARKQQENETAVFRPLPNTMLPRNIAFITTGATASASELVINSLASHVSVAMIGSDTLGKAVGQYAFDQLGCETRLRLVAFDFADGDGNGEYFSGLAATGRFVFCPADDDVSRPFGDPEEASLRVALEWLNTGSCSSRSSFGRDAFAQGMSSTAAPWRSSITSPDTPWRQ